MEKKPTTDHAMANGGYRPITEGYQPGSQLIRKGGSGERMVENVR